MIIFFEIPWIWVLIPVAIVGILLFLISGSFLDVGDAVQAFADANTFYIMIGTAAVLLAIVFISIIIKNDGFKDAVLSFLITLPFVISITLGLTNAWTIIPTFFSQFNGFDDIFTFILFGWIIFIVSVLFYGFFAVLFLGSGILPLAGFLVEDEVLGIVATIALYILSVAANLWALLKLTPYFMNSIAHIF
ncbi:MAG: hypothetical protein ACI4XE_03285 [Acutalibacteraceae bacterium]